MKFKRNYRVPRSEFHNFLDDHKKELMSISYDVPSMYYLITIEREMSEQACHLEFLHDLRESEETTLEEKNAIDYAIGAIKTLTDMGVLKDD